MNTGLDNDCLLHLIRLLLQYQIYKPLPVLALLLLQINIKY